MLKVACCVRLRQRSGSVDELFYIYIIEEVRRRMSSKYQYLIDEYNLAHRINPLPPKTSLPSNVKAQYVYNDNADAIPSEYREGFGDGFKGGSRRNKATPKPTHDDMTMKDIKELCKANLIKLSKVVDNKRVVCKKKELITKLKRKKLL